MTASRICCGFLHLCLVFNETECEAVPAAEDITLDDRSAELTAPAEARNIVK